SGRKRTTKTQRRQRFFCFSLCSLCLCGFKHFMKRSLFLLILFVALTQVSVSMNGVSLPVVEKVDPPGWWIGHSINPLQVVIRGRGFNQTRLRTDTPGVSVAGSKVSATGDYLIAYINIDPKRVAAGSAILTIEGSQGSTKIDFPLQELPEGGG